MLGRYVATELRPELELFGRAFTANVGSVCNMQKNKLCLTLVDGSVFYDPIQVQGEHTSYIELGDDPRFVATCHCDYGHDDDEVSIDTQTASIDTTLIAEQLATMTFEAATSPVRATPSRFDVLTPDEALSSAIRSRGLIVLNIAPSGIAALLLEGGSDRAKLVKEAKLIVWDEVPMMSRHCFETLDRSMRDIIRSSENKPFRGKVVVFGGDFRQVLLVIPGRDKDLYRHRTILTPTNDEVDKINDYILSKLLGEEKVYLSSANIIPSEVDIKENVVYPIEFLNSAKVAGLPRHCLKLKVGAPVMCLRNMECDRR
uniref:ATP-dependent DNA helicase n=1 Tax=Brassica oleracea TaxID=3712 RepID=A0A3P6GDP7_BRAOL|nr:unnamed protein product [Brassica oleracea]